MHYSLTVCVSSAFDFAHPFSFGAIKFKTLLVCVPVQHSVVDDAKVRKGIAGHLDSVEDIIRPTVALHC